MSTCNFHNKNASEIFACELETDFDFDDLLDNISYEIDKIKCSHKTNGSDPDGLRSYPSTIISGLVRSKDYKEFNIEVTVSAIIRSAYYYGCNLDWSITYDINGWEMTDDIDFESTLLYNSYCTEKMAAYKAKLAREWANREAKELVNEIERVFEKYSTPLVCIGVFSNGEAVYREANSLRAAVA